MVGLVIGHFAAAAHEIIGFRAQRQAGPHVRRMGVSVLNEHSLKLDPNDLISLLGRIPVLLAAVIPLSADTVGVEKENPNFQVNSN